VCIDRGLSGLVHAAIMVVLRGALSAYDYMDMCRTHGVAVHKF